MDEDHIFVIDPATTEDPHLDSILKEIGDEPQRRNTRYWIEYLSPRSEAITAATLNGLEEKGILVYHNGGFWSLSQGVWQPDAYATPDHIPSEFVKGRIAKVLLEGEIPHPTDAILVALANSAEIARKNGPVFRLNAPIQKGGLLFLAGPEINHWMQRVGRIYLRSRDYLSGFEQVYGASRILPSMDGADHFRMRKAIQATYSRTALADRLDELYHHSREYMAKWKVGDVLSTVQVCQDFINSQFSQLSVGINTQEEFQDLIKFKERSLVTHVQRALPEFMLRTPGMNRRKKRISDLVSRIMAAHTPTQRAGCPRDIVDDVLSLHAADPQFLPETDLPFSLISPLIVSLYMGNAMSFALYNLLRRPELYRQIQDEADRVFAAGDPEADSLSKSEIDLTDRFFMESQRLYPIIPMSIRTVMNACMVEGYELPVGAKIHIVHSATHYMEEIFPDPFTFDIERHHKKSEKTHRSTSYVPFGLGTHRCLGLRWVELHLAVSLLMLVHHFRFEMANTDYQLRINPFPTMSPTSKMKIRIAEKRHELNSSSIRPPRAFVNSSSSEAAKCPVAGAA